MSTKRAREKVAPQLSTYYGYVPNIVQVMRDPEVSSCYVFRVLEEDNWCFVVNFELGDSLDDWMIEDEIILEDDQVLSRSMFGQARFI